METEFECSPGKCIPKTWLCDHQRDCADGLDEKNCGSKLSMKVIGLIYGTSGEETKEEKRSKVKRNYGTQTTDQIIHGGKERGREREREKA